MIRGWTVIMNSSKHMEILLNNIMSQNGKGRKPEDAVKWETFRDAPIWDTLDDEKRKEKEQNDNESKQIPRGYNNP